MSECKADLRRWRQDWYVWRQAGGFWQQKSPEWMRADAGKWLDKLGVPHTLTGKSNLMEALLTRTFLDDAIKPPRWTGDAQKRMEDAGRNGHVFVAMRNGVLDLDEWLSSGELDKALLPHSPDFWTLCALPYAFKPEATCPKFDAALKLWQPLLEAQLLLQTWAGYCFVPGHPEQVFLLNLGPGGDGKSQWATVLTALVGVDNTSGLGLEDFDPRKEFGREPLLGKMLNITADANDLDRVAEGILKGIVGGDSISINRKHKSVLNEPIPAKFMFNANQLPPFRDRSEGIWRRMLLLHWEPVPHAQRVREFGKHIVADEIQGIFNWATLGYDRVRKIGLKVDQAGELYQYVLSARGEVQKERQFFDEKIGYAPESTCETSKERIVEAYQEYCLANAIKKGLYGDNLIKAMLHWLKEKHPESADKIKNCSVQRHVVAEDLGTRKRRYYRGVSLLREADQLVPS